MSVYSICGHFLTPSLLFFPTLFILFIFLNTFFVSKYLFRFFSLYDWKSYIPWNNFKVLEQAKKCDLKEKVSQLFLISGHIVFLGDVILSALYKHIIINVKYCNIYKVLPRKKWRVKHPFTEYLKRSQFYQLVSPSSRSVEKKTNGSTVNNVFISVFEAKARSTKKNEW